MRTSVKLNLLDSRNLMPKTIMALLKHEDGRQYNQRVQAYVMEILQVSSLLGLHVKKMCPSDFSWPSDCLDDLCRYFFLCLKQTTCHAHAFLIVCHWIHIVVPSWKGAHTFEIWLLWIVMKVTCLNWIVWRKLSKVKFLYYPLACEWTMTLPMIDSPNKWHILFWHWLLSFPIAAVTFRCVLIVDQQSRTLCPG